MDRNRKSVLQRELEIYLGSLKKYKTVKNHELTSSSVHHLSKNSSSKQPTFSGYTMLKNSSQQFRNHSYNTFNQACVGNQRTVLYNNPNHFKSKYKLTANKTARNNSLNIDKYKMVSNRYPATQSKKPALCTENFTKRVSKLSPATSVKVSSNSRSLVREIESLTEILKKTSENRSKSIKSSIKDTSTGVNKFNGCESVNSNFKYSAMGTNVLKNESKFSKINDPFKNEFKIISSNTSTTVELKKKSNVLNLSNFVSGQKNKNISTYNSSLNRDKYCYKKVNEKKIISKATCSPLKSIDNGKNLNSNIYKNISQSHVQKVPLVNVKSVAGGISCDSKLEVKPLSHDKVKLDITDPVMSRTKNSNIYPGVHKSRNIHNLSNLSKINGSNNKYKRVNTDHSVILSKNYRLKNSSPLVSSATKKAKAKLNTKFKIINKTVSPFVSKKAVFNKNSVRSKENSPLILDKSDPVYGLINDLTVDKIEEDLLAVKSALTSTPTSAKNYQKGLQNKSSKIDPKLNHKQSSKKSKTRISKYKVINSGAAHSSATKNKHNFSNIKKSKFSLINKHISETPLQEGKSVLIKRLFKSRNAIINKNIISIHHSAKMIKCKYTALNKRKLPTSYSKGLFLKPKGYLSAKLYSKKSRPQKTPIVTYSQRTIRKFSPFIGNTHSTIFNRTFSGNYSKKKLHHGYGRSPVVFIRGLKYSRNSSGKTLRKLPVQDFSKIHQKVTFRTKRCVKITENKIKALTPTSANLASRVLHRSITRVLSASTKKKLIKVNSYCMFYNRFGRCNRGVKCTYIHDPSKIAVCTRFLRGTCKVDGCPFSHEITPGKMAICSFFLVGACDKDDCPYRHENLSPDAELCKAFVQGYCPSGKECKKAHILICPKYIQGNCEKGTSCAFPHPPRKEKRNVQKETDEEGKQDDALFEKVARYFQQNENASLCSEKKSDDNAVNVVVPKQRRLEEQPSFIPLSESTE